MNDIESILLDKDEIENIISRLAKRLNEDYKDKEVVVVCLLKGSMIFGASLMLKLEFPVITQLMKVSSYGAETVSSGNVKIDLDMDYDITGKDILILEDMIDTGHTLHKVKDMLLQRNPKSLKICVMFDKHERRKEDIHAEYIGTQVPDEFLVGYGLDYNEHYRNLPYVGILKREIYEK